MIGVENSRSREKRLLLIVHRKAICVGQSKKEVKILIFVILKRYAGYFFVSNNTSLTTSNMNFVNFNPVNLAKKSVSYSTKAVDQFPLGYIAIENII
jgi:hypothetical protein